MFRCPICNRFLAKVRATAGYFPYGCALDKVMGVCKVHGEVEAIGEYGWDDFKWPEGVW